MNEPYPVEQRRNERFEFKQPVSFQIQKEMEWDGALSSNLSKGGICLIVNDFVPLNTEVNLQFHLDKNHVVELTARVVRVEHMPFSERYRVAVEFKEPLSFSKDILEAHQHPVSRRF